jgi:peptidoglycan/xylan/chitin deacetylase (PgdA/CDA1 family)
LTQLSVAECSAEIVGSKKDLATLLGLPVVSFAYPYGRYNDTVCGLVRSEFDLSFSVEEGINYLRGDPHLLRRGYVGPSDSLFEFAVKVRKGGELKWLANLRIKLALRPRIKRALGRLN